MYLALAMTSAIPWPFNDGTTKHNLQRDGAIKREIKEREGERERKTVGKERDKGGRAIQTDSIKGRGDSW